MAFVCLLVSVVVVFCVWFFFFFLVCFVLFVCFLFCFDVAGFFVCLVLIEYIVCSVFIEHALWASGWLLTEGFSALAMYLLLILSLLLLLQRSSVRKTSRRLETEVRRTRKRKTQKEERASSPQSQSSSAWAFACPNCSRVCSSRFGLYSHQLGAMCELSHGPKSSSARNRSVTAMPPSRGLSLWVYFSCPCPQSIPPGPGSPALSYTRFLQCSIRMDAYHSRSPPGQEMNLNHRHKLACSEHAV